ncbi:hypothetical protein F5883DRAFT_162968 [Diaporthe sp. PMI_573]|nr:hypothetical protein F5883DRAFT_162968 [Diaporthaceae sp. PMI_573]
MVFVLGCPNIQIPGSPPQSRLPSCPTAQEADVGPTDAACMQAKCSIQPSSDIVHSLIVRAATILYGVCSYASMASVGLHAGEESPSWRPRCPDDSGLRSKQTPDPLGLPEPARPARGTPVDRLELGVLASPRFLPLSDPAACSGLAGHAARKGARGSKIGSGSESGPLDFSTRPCRLAGLLRLCPTVSLSGPPAAQSPSLPPFTGFADYLWASTHHQATRNQRTHNPAPTIKSAPRLARHPFWTASPGPQAPP